MNSTRATLSILIISLLGLILGFMAMMRSNTNKPPKTVLVCQTTNIIPLGEQTSNLVIIPTSHGPDKAKLIILTLCVDRKIALPDAMDVFPPATGGLESKLIELYRKGEKIPDIETDLAREVTGRIRERNPKALSGTDWIIRAKIVPSTPWPATTPTPKLSGTTA